MGFGVKRLSLAEADAFQAARWYDEQRACLGDDFLDEVAAVTDALARNALLHAIRFADVRRAPFKRFRQYGVFYFLDGDAVIVFAVFHGARHSRWLRGRGRELP
jgi:plasmid stabilization system protein ParE